MTVILNSHFVIIDWLQVDPRYVVYINPSSIYQADNTQSHKITPLVGFSGKLGGTSATGSATPMPYLYFWFQNGDYFELAPVWIGFGLK